MAERTGEEFVRLYGRIFLEMDIHAVTGLRIGGSPAALAIGGIDNPIIRDPLTQRPYIPGSSLRGKMRSLWEKQNGSVQNYDIQRGTSPVYIHSMKKSEKPDTDRAEEFEADPVCRIFGVTGEINVPNPTRLIVHDTRLSDESVRQLDASAHTDQPYTETKWEAVIDRITSAAVPRQMERVPAGTIFSDCRLVYSVYGDRQRQLTDVDWFFDVLEMLLLIEDDYLGSSGSRGSGRIQFTNIKLSARAGSNYSVRHMLMDGALDGVEQIIPYRAELAGNIRQLFAQ